MEFISKSKIYIAIDDTYGGGDDFSSRYITTNRRSNVAVFFNDFEVDKIRESIKNCLDVINKQFQLNVDEFHFVDIYNKNGLWSGIDGDNNLLIFDFFACIYKKHRWKIILQTIDDRTRKDHPIPDEMFEVAKAWNFDLKKNDHLSLFFLLLKIRLSFSNNKSVDDLFIFMDEGFGKKGKDFVSGFFNGNITNYKGCFASSKEEPLLQIADFLAFCINRMTILATKKNRTKTDEWFLSLCGSMQFNCEDLKMVVFDKGFTVDDFDFEHKRDRIIKGLE